MKKAAAFLFALLLLAGCSVQPPLAEDQAEGGGSHTEGWALSDGAVGLSVSPSETAVQITPEDLMTNTEKIVVSAGELDAQATISLYLYHTDDPDTPILYATLSAHEPKAEFTNLTAAALYKVGAVMENAENSVMLRITD